MTNLDPAVVSRRFGRQADVGHLALTGERGVVLPAFTDHHVHLHLFDEHALAARGVAGILDLGGDPFALARRAEHAVPRPGYAGAFLTALRGYPAGRAWASEAVIRTVTNPSRHPGVPGGAGTAVDEQIDCGARVIKVALNADAGPVLTPDLVAAIVAHAHDRGVPVVAHVQGAGMFDAALQAGVDALAHAPFTETVSLGAIDRAVAGGQIWISTLDIHRDDAQRARTARENLAAFHTTGGRVLYGTDLGNGDLPAGIHPREVSGLVAAGLDAAAIVTALSDPWPFQDPVPGVCTFVPGRPPADDRELGAWFATASTVPREEVTRDEP
ncbi:amidohydrolase family protein [Microbacterium sp. SSW1-59]|uniref:amidohydrolase family protein n=1 Tax=Microbacterium xanthum TaxID=3079794 RepID=UPI002AD21BF2|nr:amidohydrolase family protein [Microbacterium sp. SSW1-59]MDZ8200495.1 amidohydrolase family protein [Microbacterium sp. SSW1-59]